MGQIDAQIETTTSDYDREKLNERKAKLAGGVAVLSVGGATEVEVKERKDRVEDAMNATRAAVEEGILPGGGSALLYAAQSLGRRHRRNDDQTVGVGIVRTALESPIRQISANAGVEGAVVVGKLVEGKDERSPKAWFLRVSWTTRSLRNTSTWFLRASWTPQRWCAQPEQTPPPLPRC